MGPEERGSMSIGKTNSIDGDWHCSIATPILIVLRLHIVPTYLPTLSSDPVGTLRIPGTEPQRDRRARWGRWTMGFADGTVRCHQSRDGLGKRGACALHCCHWSGRRVSIVRSYFRLESRWACFRNGSRYGESMWSLRRGDVGIEPSMADLIHALAATTDGAPKRCITVPCTYLFPPSSPLLRYRPSGPPPIRITSSKKQNKTEQRNKRANTSSSPPSSLTPR